MRLKGRAALEGGDGVVEGYVTAFQRRNDGFQFAKGVFETDAGEIGWGAGAGWGVIGHR